MGELFGGSGVCLAASGMQAGTAPRLGKMKTGQPTLPMARRGGGKRSFLLKAAFRRSLLMGVRRWGA
eukprot:scaffold4209_cov91-Isochrysis_galbana.AAC.1